MNKLAPTLQANTDANMIFTPNEDLMLGVQSVLEGKELWKKSDEEGHIYLAAAEFLGSKPEETIIWEDALHAAQTAKTAGFVVLGVYDESGKDAVPEMKEICEEYFDRMDAWLAGHK